MKVIASTGREDVAMVYVVDLGDGKLVECVESVQPPIPREDKWVLLVSTMFGCPIGCSMCDAGGHYQGKPTKEQILAQIDYLVKKRYPDGTIPAKQFKIQFARMGEPSLNPSVLDVLEELPERYNAPGLMPSLSSVAPKGTGGFFERLLEIKHAKYFNDLPENDEAMRLFKTEAQKSLQRQKDLAKTLKSIYWITAQLVTEKG